MGDTGSLFCLYNPRHLHTWSATSETVPSNNKTVNAGHCGISPPSLRCQAGPRSSEGRCKRGQVSKPHWPDSQGTVLIEALWASLHYPTPPPPKKKEKKKEDDNATYCKNPKKPRRSSRTIECFRLSSFPLWPPKMEFLKDPLFLGSCRTTRNLSNTEEMKSRNPNHMKNLHAVEGFDCTVKRLQ